ncbi:unnamed protein product [Microthlaspi erraticum]|uniref:Reverse transcriptase domain-containing protein n=1 Tax=Microthlaspi erraticum TaxID=1685480 RepID=A0A6D2HKE8_9BRAS|nr:unnamed protein product [Microthlaspi erraticum]
MECVTTVSYSFLVNNSLHGHVTPTRGLRQGDPLSPYLFILCTEVLSGLCSKAQLSGALPGVRVSRRSPAVNHLLFADDTMFFTKTHPSSVQALLKNIRRYEEASGQRINANKSSITFSGKTPPDIRARVKSTLGIEKEGGVGKYLGLPENFGIKKRDIFTGLVDKICQKSINWTHRFLSGAAKQVLLKSVLSVMPSYTMSCFKLPKSLCKRIQSVLTRYWWDDKPDKRKMSWVSWDRLTIPKNEGGLGFREIEVFNDALLAKIGARIIQNPDSLLAQVLLGKYCHSSSFMEAHVPATASHGWRSIIAGRDVLRQGLGWIVGIGEHIPLWSAPWLSTSEPRQPFGPPTEASQLLKLEIRQLQLSSVPVKDSLRWLPVKSGRYSTKTGYALSKKILEPSFADGFNWQSNLWRVKTSPKLKFFLWKASANALSVGAALILKGFDTDGRSGKCGALEDVLHVLLNCPFAQKVWHLAPVLFKPDRDSCTTVKLLLSNARRMLNLPSTGIYLTPLFPWIVWFLWKARNLRIFEAKSISEEDTIHKAISEAKAWQGAQEAAVLSSATTISPPSSLPATDVDVVRCFSDAAWSSDSAFGGMGWLFKDAHGTVISQGTASKSFLPSALAAEAVAIKLALLDARAADILRLVCYSDCKELVLLLKSGGHSNEIQGLLLDISCLLGSFRDVDFVFIPRAQNSEADVLAKSSLLSYNPSLSRG